MPPGRKFLISLCFSLLLFSVFWGIVYFKFFDSVEEKLYLPVVAKVEAGKIRQISVSLSEYIEEQNGRFRLFAGNSSVRNSVGRDADSQIISSRTKLLENLLAQCPALRGVRIIDTSGANLVFTSFPADMENKNGKFVFKNKNNSFENLTVGESEQNRIIFDEKQNQLIFAYPFFAEKAVYFGTILFYLDVPELFKHAVPEEAAANSIACAAENADLPHSGFVVFADSVTEEKIKSVQAGWNENMSVWSAFKPDSVVFNEKLNNENYLTVMRSYSISRIPQNLLVIVIAVSFFVIFLLVMPLVNLVCRKPKADIKTENEDEKNIETVEQKDEDEEMFLRKKNSTEKVKDSLSKMLRHNSVSYFMSPMNGFEDEEPEETTAVLVAEKEPENEVEKDDFDLVMNSQTERAAQRAVEKADEVKITVEEVKLPVEPEKDLFVIDSVPVVEEVESAANDITVKKDIEVPVVEKVESGTNDVKDQEPVAVEEVQKIPQIQEEIIDTEPENLEELPCVEEEELSEPVAERTPSGIFSGKNAYPSIFSKTEHAFPAKKKSLLHAAEAKLKEEEKSAKEAIFEENGIFKIRKDAALLNNDEINYEFKHLVDSIIKN
ncbi:MAG: hypothetical protein J6T84_02020 [Spirochaetaceae bacterium]|nr:hypothetical protein [Spirochaetaceae bacterium]